MDINDPVEMDTTIDTPAHTLGTQRHPQFVASSPPTTPPGCLAEIETLLLLLERQGASTDQREIRSQATLKLMPVEPVSSMTKVKLYNEAGEETEEEACDSLELPSSRQLWRGWQESQDDDAEQNSADSASGDDEGNDTTLPYPHGPRTLQFARASAQGLSSSCKDVVSCGAVNSKNHVGNWGFSEAELVPCSPFHRYGRASSTADTAAGSTASTESTTFVTHVTSPASSAAVEAAAASAPAVTLGNQTRWPLDCNGKPTKAQSYAVLALFFISLSAVVLVSVFVSRATGGGAGESSPAVTAGSDGGGGAQDVVANEGGDKGENSDNGGGRDGAPLSVALLITPSPPQTTQPGQVCLCVCVCVCPRVPVAEASILPPPSHVKFVQFVGKVVYLLRKVVRTYYET